MLQRMRRNRLCQAKVSCQSQKKQADTLALSTEFENHEEIAEFQAKKAYCNNYKTNQKENQCCLIFFWSCASAQMRLARFHEKWQNSRPKKHITTILKLIKKKINVVWSFSDSVPQHKWDWRPVHAFSGCLDCSAHDSLGVYDSANVVRQWDAGCSTKVYPVVRAGGGVSAEDSNYQLHTWSELRNVNLLDQVKFCKRNLPQEKYLNHNQFNIWIEINGSLGLGWSTASFSREEAFDIFHIT